ncbi:MAG: hypothetical protein KGR70_16925 [Cyanobacteria bacterium REEB494]|nr:hypothetical protein [Cyanobacteria bacterium REEB494]
MYTVERQLYESLLGKRVSDSHWSNLKKTAQEADHVITLDEPPELSQNKEITLAEKQTISTVAKDLSFILPQEELKAIAQHSLREIASSLREDSEITSITEIKEAILRFIAKKGERTRREVDTALSEIATAYAAEQLISSRLFASSLANLSKEVKVAKGWNGVRHIVAVELRNNMDLAQAVKVVKVIPSDDVLAPYFALGGTALLITAATISHKLTQHQAVQLLSSLRGIKGAAGRYAGGICSGLT